MTNSTRPSRLFGCVCAAVIVAGAVAQVVIPCCKYNYEWPGVTAGDECSGTSTEVCETSSTSCGQSDPLCKYRAAGTRYARCCVYELGPFASFLKDDCGLNPPPGARIGKLPDGSCCWILGEYEYTCENRDFQVGLCTGAHCQHD